MCIKARLNSDKKTSLTFHFPSLLSKGANACFKCICYKPILDNINIYVYTCRCSNIIFPAVNWLLLCEIQDIKTTFFYIWNNSPIHLLVKCWERKKNVLTDKVFYTTDNDNVTIDSLFEQLFPFTFPVVLSRNKYLYIVT